MKKYVLLGVLAIMLVAIPMAVAAAPATGNVQVTGSSTVDQEIQVTPATIALPTLIPGTTVTTDYVDVQVSSNVPRWHVVATDDNNGHMYKNGDGAQKLIDALQIQGLSGEGLESLSGTTAVEFYYGSTTTPGYSGWYPVTPGLGGVGATWFSQKVENTDNPGSYVLNVVFTIGSY
ncbi:MAG: hypothetical protein ABSD81_01420 [Methanomicrobiales archaeon]|jgi:hypothetical protein